MTEYETFYARDLREGEEFQIELMDRESKELFQARVRVAKRAEDLPGSSRLWVRDSTRGNVAPQGVWYVSILQRLEDEEPEVKRVEIPLEERHGFLLRSLIEERLSKGEDPRTGGRG